LEEDLNHDKKKEKHHLLLRDQIVTVVERFVLERQINSLNRKIEED